MLSRNTETHSISWQQSEGHTLRARCLTCSQIFLSRNFSTSCWLLRELWVRWALRAWTQKRKIKRAVFFIEDLKIEMKPPAVFSYSPCTHPSGVNSEGAHSPRRGSTAPGTGMNTAGNKMCVQGLTRQGAAHCTDCKAPWECDFAAKQLFNLTWLTWPWRYVSPVNQIILFLNRSNQWI